MNGLDQPWHDIKAILYIFFGKKGSSGVFSTRTEHKRRSLHIGGELRADLGLGSYFFVYLLYIRLTMKNLIGREHSINSH